MRKIAESLCVVESKIIGRTEYEVCASETADFDESNSVLRVDLASFVRRVNPHGRDDVLHPGWLPGPEVLQHHLPKEDASEDAREIFQNWRRKLKQAIPNTKEFCASLNELAARDRTE